MIDKTIVVVDDDPYMNIAMKRLLEAAGFQVISFFSAEELLSSKDSKTSACFVLDVQLPKLNGFELLQKLRAEGIRAPAIFITAFDDTTCVEKTRASDAIACLYKPFPSHEILSIIKRAVRDTESTLLNLPTKTE